MNKNPVINYYHSPESRLGYRLLKGLKHFGYYPEGKEDIPMLEAQMLMNEQLAKKLSQKSGSRVLDAGCGEGNVAMYLAEHHGLKVDAIDLLDFNIANAKANAIRQNQSQNVTFQVGTYMQLSYADNSFDAVYTMETLVHAPDYRKALSEFLRVLKPGGKLVLFEYALKPKAEVTQSEEVGMQRIKQINRVAAMPAFDEFTFGSMAPKLLSAGFEQAETIDITQRMLPMLEQFYHKAKLIYRLFRVLHIEDHLINGMSAVEFYKNQGLWKYEITTGIK